MQQATKEIIKPGDKVDIELLFQKEQLNAGKKVDIRVFKSSVSDVLDNDRIEMYMPTENGKMYLFQVGLRCEMVFMTAKGMRKAIGRVQERYKKGNLYFVVISLDCELIKVQRREFFRIACSLDIQFYCLGDMDTQNKTLESVYLKIQNSQMLYSAKHGIINDISGGGMRFTTDEQLEAGSRIFAIIYLESGSNREKLYVLCDLISSERNEKVRDKFSNRACFLFENLADREKIVRFVFEEERRIRNKENG